MTKYETAERMQQKWARTEGAGGTGGGGRAGIGGARVGGGWKKQVKLRGAGQEREKKTGSSKLSAGRRSRWRVPEFTPTTPGPAASAD